MKAVFDTLHTPLRQVEGTQANSIHEAGQLVANCLANKGIIYSFGAGHSHILAEESFFRAGGLTAVNPIFDAGLMLHESALTSTDLERLEGCATLVLRRYTFSSNDFMIIVSNLGWNATSIEAAMGPTSTLIGAALLHAVIYKAIFLLLARGIQPAVIRSANLDSTQDLGEIVSGLRGQVRTCEGSSGQI